MGLSAVVVTAVLAGALLHALWNVLIKSGREKSIDTAGIHGMASIIALPGVAMLGLPPAETWPFIGASVVIHVGYYLALVSAYEHGDLGLTYPLMRGTAPMLVAGISTGVLGESLSAMAWIGVAGISLGVLLLGFSSHALGQPRAVLMALINAAVIAAYTLVDGLGVRHSTTHGGTALQYVCLLFALEGWPYALWVLRQRGASVVHHHVRERLKAYVFAAIASVGSYGIALWAMTQAPVAMVAALRETSVLFAVVLGTWLLKERFTPHRAVGTAVMLVGVAALRLG
jgi:phosphonate utilization associated putative membrane protein